MLTPYLDAPERLDAYSQQMAEKIFSRHPEWRQLSQISDDDTLVVTIPWSQNPCGDIILATFHEELTLFVGNWHWHFNDSPYFETPDQGLDLVDQIFVNEVGFLVNFYGRESGGGNLTEVSVKEEIEKIKRRYRSSDSRKTKVNITVKKFYWTKETEESEYHK